jgi:hypothetical protein
MTVIAVPLSITIKVYEQKIKYEKEIAVQELEKSISEIVQELGGQILKAGIKGLDEELRTTVPDTWQNQGTEERSVVSSLGWVQYQRRVYRDETGKRRKPVDEVLGLEPYARMSGLVEQMGAYLASESNYREAANRLSWMLKTEISHSAIQRMVWKVGNLIADMAEAERERIFTGGGGAKKGKIKTDVLYGESDGVWLHLQQEARKSIEVRVGVMYTGKVPIGYKRYALENKHSVVAIDVSSEAWQEELLKVGHQWYDLESVQLLIAGGDGNGWVKNSFARFELQQEFVLDRFHLSRAARRALGNRKLTRKIMKQLRKEGFPAVKDELLEMIDTAQDKWKEKLQMFYRYLSNNQRGLRDLVPRGYSHKLGSLGAIEGNVDKLVVRRMKGRGRSWKRRGLRAMLGICQNKTLLRNLAFQYQPVAVTKKPKRKRMSLSVDYSECFQGSIPIFSGPDQGKPWVNSLHRFVHGI